MILLIRNLDRSTDRIQLHALLRQFGKVETLDLVVDPETGKSKGFAFAEMSKEKEGKLAISGLNNTKVGANIIRVKKAANSTVQKGRAAQPAPPEDPGFRPRRRKQNKPRGRR